MQDKGKTKFIASIVIIAAIVLIAFAASALKKDESDNAIDTTSNVADTNTEVASLGQSTTPATPTDSTYKDGTYTISDSYISPGGTEDIKVSVTVENNLITNAEITQNANNHESEEFQSKFRNGYKSKVVGKALATLELSRVSGASLTTASFNEALDEIRNQAKV